MFWVRNGFSRCFQTWIKHLFIRMKFYECFGLAFEAVNLLGFKYLSYEGTFLYKFILIRFFQERFGYRDIQRKINLAPEVMGYCTGADQFPARQVINDGQVPGFESGLMPQCILDCAAEQLRPAFAESDQADGLAVDLVRPQILADMFNPSSCIQLDLHVIRIIDGFVTHTESNGRGAGIQQLRWHRCVKHGVSIQEQEFATHNGARQPATHQIIRNFEEGIKNDTDLRAVGVALLQQSFN